MLDFQEERLRIRYEAAQRRLRRRQFVEDKIAAAVTARAANTAWLEAFSGVPVPGSPGAGANWAALTAGQKAEALRDGLSRALLQCRGRDEIIEVLARAVLHLVEADDEIEVPE